MIDRLVIGIIGTVTPWFTAFIASLSEVREVMQILSLFAGICVAALTGCSIWFGWHRRKE